jgi:hypothetical protein
LGNHQLYAVYDLLLQQLEIRQRVLRQVRVSEYVMAMGINNRSLGGYDMVDFNGF